jgi:hypothetical protein
MPKKEKYKPESLKKDNSVGLTVNKTNRIKAIKALEAAKELEQQQLKNGYYWAYHPLTRSFVLTPPKRKK